MHYRIKLLILSFSVAACQSAHFVVPATEAYRTTEDRRQTIVASPTEPILTAALPPLATPDEAKAGYAELQPDPMATTTRVLAPDTTVKQSPAPVVGGKPDPTTTAVNIAGAVITAVGIGVIIANSGEAPHTEWGGLSQLISVLGGIIMALFGLALLFFQGKNGRLRRLREARKAAAPTPEQSPAVAPDPAAPSGQASHKHKTGLRLMIAGGVIGLLGFLAGGYFLLGLLIAVVLLVIGAVFSITGN